MGADFGAQISAPKKMPKIRRNFLWYGHCLRTVYSERFWTEGKQQKAHLQHYILVCDIKIW